MFPILKVMMDNSARNASNCGVKVFLPDYRIVPQVDCKQVPQSFSSLALYF